MLGIHRNPNRKEFLKSCESFLRKSQFSKLRYLNPGFGGPWDMLGIFFVNVIFITLQKKSFGQKKFEFHAQVQKCHFGNFSILAKWHFWTRAWNSNFFLAERLLLKCYKVTFSKNICNMSQGPPNPGFRSVRVENWDFLKKDSQDFKNSFRFGFLWIPSKTWEQN